MTLLKQLSLAMWILCTPIVLFGGPASPDVLTVKQPDGTVIQARMRGDEFQGWMETLGGYTIVKNEVTGCWEYGINDKASGTLRPSGHLVLPDSETPAALDKHVKPPRNTEFEQAVSELRHQAQQRASAADNPAHIQTNPVSGTKKLLVILVNFSDRTLTTTATGWYNAIFQTGTGVKSVQNFYLDNSFNTLDIVPVVHTQTDNPAGVVTVTISVPHPNYGGNETYSSETAWLNAALAQASTHVDFAALDTNGNGTITVNEAVFYFIPAGYETSGTDKTPSIWAHAWGGTPGLTAGTKRVNRWAMNGELNHYDRQHPMGVIAHELGHAMTGLPDLYDTNDINEGLGAFSLMASGSWGADTDEDGGTTPVSLDAWSRIYLGWTTPQVPTSETVTLSTCLAGTTAAAQLQNSAASTTEYFLVENRHSSAWDRGMSRWLGTSWSGGLLILHVDEAIASNAYVAGSHQKVMAEHANNANYGTVGSAGSFFKASGNASFTPTSVPSSSFYSMASAIVMTNVSAPGTSMTFDMSLITDATPPTGQPSKPTGSTTSDRVTFAWTQGTAADADSGIAGYRLQIGTTTGGSDVFNGIVGNVLTKTLTNLGQYDDVPLYARVAALNGAGGLGAYSASSNGVTLSLPTFDSSVLDNASLTFKTPDPWTTDTTTHHAGGSSARSAPIGNSGSTYLQTKVIGPGTLSFYWKVGSEANFDFLTVSLDGVNQPGAISGTTNWNQKSVSIPTGSHVVRWTYAKDEADSSGTDAGWVDLVAYLSGPTITSFSPTVGCIGTSVVITGTNFSDASAVKFNDQTATFTINSATQITATVPSGATSGTISVTNANGTTTSASNFTIKSLDLNEDTRVDLKDLARIATCFGLHSTDTAYNVLYDLNEDDVINEQDVTLFFNHLN